MKKIVLLDGGMGQELIAKSKQKPHPMWSAKVLLDEPEIVNGSPYEECWFFKIRLDGGSEFENLMTEEEYTNSCEE